MILSPDYPVFLSEVKSRILQARIGASRVINHELINLYWTIGKAIVEKQEALAWGKAIVEKLSKDLQKAFPGSKGYSADNLWRMRQLYAEYSDVSILEQAVPELAGKRSHGSVLERIVPEWCCKTKFINKKKLLHWEKMIVPILTKVPWGHHVLILKKIKPFTERLYYLKATTVFGWSRNVLLNQINGNAYGHFLKDGKTSNFKLALPTYLAEQAEEALKSSYNLEFLGIKEALHERKLESRLIERLKNFILELGYGFCFIGSQYRVLLGKNEYFIDLLFYHRFLKSLVAVELKTGKFKPEYAGKMDFYLNVLNASEKAPDDQPSIGIILCAERDKLEVEFSLRTKSNPIGVAEYKLHQSLPDDLKGKLPTSNQLIEGLKR